LLRKIQVRMLIAMINPYGICIKVVENPNPLMMIVPLEIFPTIPRMKKR